ncbi:CYTH domain-containing protein [Halorhodospira halochloris]|uniref:CYTH domain-containing protein n=1 Tax=Halorhodospira halochloris TaxID=1052 RepID=UPI001EE93C53|nr:CYTH domain-containing protein [Halorhodospira halochloris]MCG5531371.1 CYTH domain-containing protein [Halorhodospira halochloris]
MAQEIERKFLLKNDDWRDYADSGQAMRQGYLIGAEKASIRVRTAADRAWLNIKSATLGVERLEYEYEIPLTDAEEMLESLCERPLIEKVRYEVAWHGDVWEIDVFEGDNAGLVVAEIELEDPQQQFTLPPWVGEEVSDDPRYYNVCLVKHPFSQW